MLAAAAFLIVWDIKVATNKDRGDTISEITLAASRRGWWSLPVLAWVCGILMGHLWWPQVVKPRHPKDSPINSGPASVNKATEVPVTPSDPVTPADLPLTPVPEPTPQTQPEEPLP
jgi:hypothetical protein